MRAGLGIQFFRKIPEPSRAIERAYEFGGVTFIPPLGCGEDWLRRPLDHQGQESLVAFLAQAEEEGFSLPLYDNHLILPWKQVYQLLESADHRDGCALMGLPPIGAWRPRLESQGGLADEDFAILLAGWISPAGERIADDVHLCGAVVVWKGKESLLTKEAWLTVEAIKFFHHRWFNKRNSDDHRRAWAGIRRHALAAGADLSDFLARTVVLTPDKLRLRLRRGDTGTKLVEIIPDFVQAPNHWIDCFDRGDQVLDRYDIPQGEGITQVMLSPPVKSVLREIKGLPGRRVAGARAEAFLRNPFSVLGPDAATVLDPAEFEAERQRAGLCFARFTPELIRNDDGMLCKVALHIEEYRSVPASPIQHSLDSITELAKFVASLRERIAQEAQCCSWNGHELEILGETPEHLASLEQALAEWRKQEIFTLGEIMDLSQYSPRIEGFGEGKPYYSSFVGKANKSEWFPEELIYGVIWQPEDGSLPIAMRMSKELLDDLERRLVDARNAEANSVTVPDFPTAIPVKEAERILESLRQVRKDAANRSVHGERLKPIKSECLRKQLILRSNVEKIDYEERRGHLSLRDAAQPDLPATLRPEFSLKSHQYEGLQWLKHLFAHSPVDCRGALLADEMGLGKTLQILAFIARRLEIEPDADPVLIVAPVALLENWKEEVDKFFAPGALPMLPLYGKVLASKRLSREAIEAEIGQAGLGQLLVRNWLGDARIVLTTYETLRDLEFSLARQKWSVMVCDEAQKIKNPNSMVSQAARKQNARFKIACTGTPVENSLTDLWCLFDFIQPGLLGSLATFASTYKRPIESKSAEELAQLDKLRALIEPQTLRRTQKEVARDLPSKIVVQACRKLVLSNWQRSLYAQAMQEFRRTPGADTSAATASLRMLTYLRMLCSDPVSIPRGPAEVVSVTDLEKTSPKMAWLLAELTRIRKREEKVLVFCESRSVQRTLQRVVGERLRVVPDIINGQTSTAEGDSNNRQRRIAEFQNKPGFGVIILSPLAVGFGLNLQAANHVIHFTRSWNPAKEDQATDRAYRIGQTRDVLVYCPVVTAPDFQTFDALLDKLLERKRDLSRDMLNGAEDLQPHDFAEL